jgi:xanthine/CO dehydrogenase XdhC/CoxF family maturation factor
VDAGATAPARSGARSSTRRPPATPRSSCGARAPSSARSRGSPSSSTRSSRPGGSSSSAPSSSRARSRPSPAARAGGRSSPTRARASPPRPLPGRRAGRRRLAGGRIARVGGIDAATAVAVLTHDPKVDDEALALALRSPAFFVGAIGARRTQAARRERLLARGLTEAELDRLSGPIGLDLGATTPAETALSIMAEIVAVAHGRSGGRLRDAAGRIHEEPR